MPKGPAVDVDGKQLSRPGEYPSIGCEQGMTVPSRVVATLKRRRVSVEALPSSGGRAYCHRTVPGAVHVASMGPCPKAKGPGDCPTRVCASP